MLNVFVQKAMLTPWYISKLMVPCYKNIIIIGTVDIQKNMVLHYHGACPKP